MNKLLICSIFILLLSSCGNKINEPDYHKLILNENPPVKYEFSFKPTINYDFQPKPIPEPQQELKQSKPTYQNTRRIFRRPFLRWRR